MIKRVVIFLACLNVIFVPIVCSGEESSSVILKQIKPEIQEGNPASNNMQANKAEKGNMSRVDRIEILVQSAKLKIAQNNPAIEKTFAAATASRRSEKSIPYKKVGHIWKIVLNPPWSPTENIQKEEIKKRGKKLPKVIPPGKGNPLGIVKFYILFDGSNSNLGVHNTNSPNSIGKRVSHGCTRLSKDDATELARLLLKQNGFDPDDLFEQATKNPKKSIVVELSDRPDIVHFKI